MKSFFENTVWECHLCANEFDFECLPSGYLGNFHPLCKKCSDEIIQNGNSRHFNRLTFHYKLGDLEKIGNLHFAKINQN